MTKCLFAEPYVEDPMPAVSEAGGVFGLIVFENGDILYSSSTQHTLSLYSWSTSSVRVCKHSLLSVACAYLSVSASLSLLSVFVAACEIYLTPHLHSTKILLLSLAHHEPCLFFQVNIVAGSAQISGDNDGAPGFSLLSEPRGICFDGKDTVYVTQALGVDKVRRRVCCL